MLRIGCILFVLNFAFVAFADPKFFNPQILLQTQAGGIGIPTQEGTVTQPIDHFSSDIRTFKQRYWSSKNFVKVSNPPVLIYLCGESKCDKGFLFNVMSAHGRELGAHLFALEHRYYGKSQPFADLSAPNLKFLSTEQALADIVEFKRAMQKQMSLQGPWILVGGSYAGDLSAYARMKYPNEFVGALASSAPVRAHFEFTQFDRQMAEIAGIECSQDTQKVLHEIESFIDSDQGFAQVKKIFAADTIQIRRDFLELLSDITSASMLYGHKDEFCKKIKANGISGYAEMKKMVDVKYENFAKYATYENEDTTLAKYSGSFAMRQWYYQQCTEYGFWQNSNPGFSMRSQRLNAQAQDELCQRLFQLPGAAAVDVTNQKYFNPLLAIQGANIFMTNGSEDPWRHLSILTANELQANSGIELRLMNDALHCEDIMGAGNSDVMAAKARFRELAKQWIKIWTAKTK